MKASPPYIPPVPVIKGLHRITPNKRGRPRTYPFDSMELGDGLIGPFSMVSSACHYKRTHISWWNYTSQHQPGGLWFLQRIEPYGPTVKKHYPPIRQKPTLPPIPPLPDSH